MHLVFNLLFLLSTSVQYPSSVVLWRDFRVQDEKARCLQVVADLPYKGDGYYYVRILRGGKVLTEHNIGYDCTLDDGYRRFHTDIHDIKPMMGDLLEVEIWYRKLGSSPTMISRHGRVMVGGLVGSQLSEL